MRWPSSQAADETAERKEAGFSRGLGPRDPGSWWLRSVPRAAAAEEAEEVLEAGNGGGIHKV